MATLDCILFEVGSSADAAVLRLHLVICDSCMESMIDATEADGESWAVLDAMPADISDQMPCDCCRTVFEPYCTEEV